LFFVFFFFLAMVFSKSHSVNKAAELHCFQINFQGNRSIHGHT